MKKQTKEVELKEGQPIWGEDGKVYLFDKKLDSVYYRKDFSGGTYYSNITPKPLSTKEFLEFMELEMGWLPYLDGDIKKMDGESLFYITKNFSKGKKTWQLCYEPFTNEDGEPTDGIWETDQELQESIDFLIMAKFIVNCLNLTV